MVFLDYSRIHIYKAYGNLGFSICVSKMGRNEKRLGRESSARHFTCSISFNPQNRMEKFYMGNPSPNTWSDFSKVAEDNK